MNITVYIFMCYVIQSGDEFLLSLKFALPNLYICLEEVEVANKFDSIVADGV